MRIHASAESGKKGWSNPHYLKLGLSVNFEYADMLVHLRVVRRGFLSTETSFLIASASVTVL